MVGKQITGLTVEGCKSFGKKQHLQRPVTLCGGSQQFREIQPLLLLKQTLESPFDPGPLKVDGPNVGFTRYSQLFTHGHDGECASALTIGLDYEYDVFFREGTTHRTVELEFQRTREGLVSLRQESVRETLVHEGRKTCRAIDFSEGKLPLDTVLDNYWLDDRLEGFLYGRNVEARVVRSRCFLDLEVKPSESDLAFFSISVAFSQQLGPLITDIIYVPGLRDPAFSRSYPFIPIDKRFPGPMHSFLASVIQHWGPDGDLLVEFERDLRKLGLTGRVRVQPVDDTALEVLVGRYIPGSSQAIPDLVNVADVGLGLSQIMPVLAALRVAQPNQLVVMEQPELHLHPRGIHKLAEIIVDAVNRGVRMIIETHSELLLLGIQTLVAQGLLDPTKVSLNWFARDEQGNSRIQQTEIESNGSFGDWPVDFLDVELLAQQQYLDAT